uniref:ABC-type glutathione-S-conjugate transporter n=1 Tax=Caenorhabditis japonica TaxID=281687 RepID=A0A8R1DMH1_CAEJA
MFPLVREIVCGNENEIFEAGWRNSTSIPHVSKCGQHTDFSTLPTLFLVLFSSVVFYQLYQSRNSRLRSCSPISLRIILCCLLVVDLTITVVYDFYLFFTNSLLYDFIHFYGDLVQYAGLCLALVLTIACRNRGIITSGVITLYWFLVVIAGIPELRYVLDGTIYKEYELDSLRSTLYVASYVFSALELFLCCFADTPSNGFIGKNSCPEYTASFLNQLTFEWFSGLAYLGNHKSLEREDLWDLNERDKSENLIPSFMKNLKPRVENYQRRIKQNPDYAVPKNHPSILIPIFKTYKFTLFAGGCYKLIFDLLQFVAPELLRQLISFIEDKNQPLWIGISIALLMFISSLVQSLILHQYFHEMFRLGMNIKSVLTSAVYSKTLNLSNEAKKGKTTGAIVNLMSVDIQRIQDMTTFIMLFWSAPLQILLALYFLWKLLGVSVLAGFLILILMIPFNSWISIKMRNCQMEQMKHKDERIKMMSEILNGMKVLKLYSWENSMEQMVLDIREKEIQVLKKLSYLNAATTLSWACAPFLVAVLTFGLYVLWDPENNILTPQITFVALALFNILRFPLAVFAMVFSQAVQCAASNTRLKEFFASEEMYSQTSISYGGTDSAVKIDNGSFSWESKKEEKTLHDITVNIKRGQLVAIVGRVGSGKSSLLHALLGEMNKISGSVQVNGSIAYVPQQAWIQNLSFRNNILFNKPYEPSLYEKVVNACALKQDLESLPAEDRTEIGEKGINLSGGQKQRVSLARAVYQNAEIILLDDPLSAVDSHVGKHIFENVISSATGFLSTKTRILVTHGLTYLKHCDQVIVVKDGTISEMGTYQELMNSNGAFSEFLEEFLLEESKHRGRSVSFGEDSREVDEILKDLDEVSPAIRQRIQSQISQDAEKEHKEDGVLNEDKHEPVNIVHKNEEKEALLGENAKEKPAPAQPKKPKTQLIEKEAVETGKVKFAVYMTYFHAIGMAIAVLFFLVYVASSALGVFSNLYLAKWSDDAKEIARSANVSTSETQIRLGIYALLGMGQATSVCAASVIMALGMVRASRLLHSSMLSNIVKSPMAFFDVTPLGRILNRFGKDVDVVDARLPGCIMAFVGGIVQAGTIFVVLVYATPASLLLIMPTLYGYLRLLRVYVSTSRQLKRLESASRSPIYSHFQESVQGASSIRAYGVVDRFIKESQNRVDENLATYYPSIVANRWLAVRLEMVGNLIVLSSAGAAVWFRDSPGLSAGLVGLSVSYALNITQTLNWAVRMTSELETNIVAVERIKEYTVTPIEGNSTTISASNSWPEKGDIYFKNYSVRYRPGLDLVLHSVTAHIYPCEKIGIVGRTGAGKSSMTLALFRIIEADGGCIEIDGKNIAQLPLEQLRSRLTIVPQDPVLFSGTMRMNLDPFFAFSDDQIWEALRNAHLESFVRSLQEGLSHQVTEGGENLSVGQRQLICLARALLRKTRVLVLDEAAAAVDVETDSLLQKTIKEQFKECTVLTIAHRLNTVMDSDRLLVLDKGRVAEFDSPKKLLSNVDGIFYSMAKDANVV